MKERMTRKGCSYLLRPHLCRTLSGGHRSLLRLLIHWLSHYGLEMWENKNQCWDMAVNQVKGHLGSFNKDTVGLALRLKWVGSVEGIWWGYSKTTGGWDGSVFLIKTDHVIGLDAGYYLGVIVMYPGVYTHGWRMVQ